MSFNLDSNFVFHLKEGTAPKGANDTHASYYKGHGMYVHSDHVLAEEPLLPGEIVFIKKDAVNSDRQSWHRLETAEHDLAFANGETLEQYHAAVHLCPQPWMVVEGNGERDGGSFRNNAMCIRGSFEVEISNYDTEAVAAYDIGTKLTVDAGQLTSDGVANRKILGEVFAYSAATDARGERIHVILSL